MNDESPELRHLEGHGTDEAKEIGHFLNLSAELSSLAEYGTLQALCKLDEQAARLQMTEKLSEHGYGVALLPKGVVIFDNRDGLHPLVDGDNLEQATERLIREFERHIKPELLKSATAYLGYCSSSRRLNR